MREIKKFKSLTYAFLPIILPKRGMMKDCEVMRRLENIFTARAEIGKLAIETQSIYEAARHDKQYL